jgi:hypothetical protein
MLMSDSASCGTFSWLAFVAFRRYNSQQLPGADVAAYIKMVVAMLSQFELPRQLENFITTRRYRETVYEQGQPT